MKCIKCNCSGMEKMLHRTNPLGQSDAGWMCIDCIEKHEPELAKNIKCDNDYKVLLDIENAVHYNPEKLMPSNCDGEKCPKCGAKEIEAMTPRTTYECGSSDYDQRPNTFKQSDKCKNMNHIFDFSLHFQTKTQSIEDITKKWYDWTNTKECEEIFGESTFDTQTNLHHCFLKEEELETLNIPDEKKEIIKKTLEFLECQVESSYNMIRWVSTTTGGLTCDRDAMLINLKRLNGIAIFIGELIDGVKEEYEYAKEIGVKIIQIF